ncbi:MAG: hypothetical protein V1827_02450 [Candidatus Micrarchaeota archaeon]
MATFCALASLTGYDTGEKANPNANPAASTAAPARFQNPLLGITESVSLGSCLFGAFSSLFISPTPYISVPNSLKTLRFPLEFCSNAHPSLISLIKNKKIE